MSYRVWAACHVDNIPLAHLLECAGLSREGKLSRCALLPNLTAEPQDCLLCGRAMR
jgi:hypothetical protein